MAHSQLETERKWRSGVIVSSVVLLFLWAFFLIRSEPLSYLPFFFLLLCIRGIKSSHQREKYFIRNGEMPKEKSSIDIFYSVNVFSIFIYCIILMAADFVNNLSSVVHITPYCFLAGASTLWALQEIKKRCEADGITVFALYKRWFLIIRAKLAKRLMPKSM